MPAGRPPLVFSPETVSAIETRILAGDSIASICDTKTFPHPESTFWRHVAKNEEFASVITRAMEMRSDRDIERCRTIAMTATADDWQVAQLQIRTLQWEAGKRRPKKYGEKIQQEHSGEVGIKTVVVSQAAKDSKPRPAAKPAFEE